MALDLILGSIPRDWSLGAAPATDEVNFRFTEDEAKMLVTLAEMKAKADSEDREAKKKFGVFQKRVAGLKAKAAKGDPSAKRLMKVLEESGLFNQGQKITIDDTSGGPVITNRSYRTAILRQAVKAAGGKRPGTVEFFKAKNAVDGVIGKAGGQLFLPGAMPGRRTV